MVNLRHFLASLCAVAALLGACGSIQETTPTPLPKDIEDWALPLTSAWNKSDSDRTVIVENYLIAKCRGLDPSIEAARAALQATQKLGPTWNSDLRRLFTPTVAAKYGYRVTATFPNAIGDPNPAPATEEPNWRRCFDELRSQHPLPPYNGTIQSIQVHADSNARHDSHVLAAIGAWRKCLTDHGVTISLDTSPNDMPTPAMMKQFEIPESAEGEPSPPEIDAALIDADCRWSSQYLKTYHQAEAANQRKLVQASAVEVAQEKEKITKYQESMLAMLNAGGHSE